MGMFDWVFGPKMNCPTCGEPLPIDQWQTKQGACLLEMIPWQNALLFYTCCSHCSTWIEFTYKNPLEPTLDDYDISIATKEDREAEREKEDNSDD